MNTSNDNLIKGKLTTLFLLTPILLLLFPAYDYTDNNAKFAFIEIAITLIILSQKKHPLNLDIATKTLLVSLLACSLVSLYIALSHASVPEAKAFRFIQHLVILPFTYCIYLQLKDRYSLSKQLIAAIIICALFVVVYQFSHLCYDSINDKSYYYRRLFLMYRRQDGQLITIAIPLLLLLSNFCKNRTLHQLGLYLCFFIVWTMLFTYSARMSILLGLASLLVHSVLTLRKHRTVMKFRQNAIIYTAILSAFVFTLALPNSTFLQESVARSSDGNLNKVSSGRLDMWSAAWNLFTESPLFGMGPDSYRVHDVGYGAHPHNALFQWLSEWGLLGTILFIIPIIYCIVTNLPTKHRTFKYSITQPYLFLTILNILTLSLISGIYYTSFNIFVCCLIFAIFAANKKSTLLNKSN